MDNKIGNFINMDNTFNCMAYIETIRRGSANFYYLTHTIIVEGKTKKVRVLLGKGKISSRELNDLAAEAQGKLEEKLASLKKIKKIISLDKEKLEKLDEIKNGYKKLISSVSKIEYDVIEKDRFIRFTFNTNAIEGSTITLKETSHILKDGISPEGKDLREIHEVENTRKAYNFMKNYKGKINIKFIKKIHYNLTYNILGEQSGKFRRIQVFMGGSKHIPAKPSEVNKEMLNLMRWMNSHSNIHPAVFASYVHNFFIDVHPFIDGNGRTGRLLLNFMLMKSGFPPICIKKEEKIKYTDYMEEARDGNMKMLLNFIAGKVEEAYAELANTIKRN